MFGVGAMVHEYGLVDVGWVVCGEELGTAAGATTT